MNDDDLLGGLNALVNQADRKPAAKPVQRPAQPPFASAAASPVEDDILSQQILERLDGIKASIDALNDTRPQVPKPAPEAKPATVDLKKPTPPRPSLPPVTRPDPVQPQVKSWWPYLVLVSAALELAAFALGMGYGAIVASGKFPFWYKPGASGALVDWIAAPAGVLLLPIIAALLAMGGRELQREGHATVAKALWAIAGGLAVIALLVPFIA
ncbi:hypothetical protein [Acidithiobacillus ferrooxidans]|uniref:Uncharacterized protein n=1 Tax=Acidithiobacillus ferrooxidans TaxID=920 RepID=A0A2W1K6R0_ACIFR|nr:hypothetical protein [Acidithiobacillus ferrooxidans]MBU2817477.1 hypothetical protein [Acidithiobacillus ferrooxidans]MCR1344017.1 hypothetical protein [Acidithiobacillus ferrooxidans]PZD82393.1 hypothetical protein DN052_05090 [Acidithiobacillus ferrooxidans]QLK41333.1 hypothetical protein FE661_03475 [Acidithiobacillus ferrooxidans]QZT53275.1 hypothetical protein K7B00_03475 [Acidithiobacillus ferrooxidans]